MPPSSALVAAAADLVVADFERHRERFRAITRGVAARYAARDWAGIRSDTVARLELHANAVTETLDRLRALYASRLDEPGAWAALKPEVTRRVRGRSDLEIAQTFFNSLTRRALDHSGIDPRVDYVAEDFPLPLVGRETALARSYPQPRCDASLLREILADAAPALGAPFVDLEEDAWLGAEIACRGLAAVLGDGGLDSVEILAPPFFRNKGAYLVGRVRRGRELAPLVLAVVHPDEAGVRLDAVLTDEDAVSVVFSFARWYFHVDVPAPREVVAFLQSILPRKKRAELYISLGDHKHGKTELYQELVRHVGGTRERFFHAPGQPGLVMIVFTLPSFEFVFKVIRDAFPPAKPTTRREVMAKYREVLRHDRVGRLVDFQEFEHVTIPRERFGEELLADLLGRAGRTVVLQGDDVVVQHMYVGRRVTPLDVFLAEADAAAAEAAVLDWGRCLKELGAAGIYIGDILLKNFGVTRHGRVVSYDYDELQPLSACTFRRLPPSRGYEQEISNEPWFSVGEGDVFPEEMRSFLGLSGRLREVFTAEHGDLFEAETWRRMQRSQEEGEILDVFPYPEASRLRPA